MHNISITKTAIDLMTQKCSDPAITSRKIDESVPLLAWASRVTVADRSANRKELGPGFHFSWSNAKEIEEYDYLTLTLDNGDELALAPGEFFRSGSYKIDQKDGRFTLVSSD